MEWTTKKSAWLAHTAIIGNRGFGKLQRPTDFLLAPYARTSNRLSCSARDSLCSLPTPAMQSPQMGSTQYKTVPLQSGVGTPHSVPCLSPKERPCCQNIALMCASWLHGCTQRTSA